MENLCKWVDVRLVTNEKKLDKLTSKPTYISSKIFNENLMAKAALSKNLILMSRVSNSSGNFLFCVCK